MKKPVHYSPNGQRPLCLQGTAVGLGTDFFMREVRRSSTDLRKVTCPACLHLMAGMMIRKGVPIAFKQEGASFYERLAKIGPAMGVEARVQNGGAA
jgi:hypothetical protein